MRRKALTSTLGTAVLVMVLAACGGAEEVPPTTTVGAPTPEASTAAPADDSESTTVPGAQEAAPTTSDPVATAPSEPTEKPAQPTDEPPADPTEAPAEAPAEPTGTDDEPAGDLPRSTSAYGEAFLRVWRDGDPAEIARFANDDTLQALEGWTPWHGAEWHEVSSEPVDGGTISGTLVHYRTDDNQQLTLSLDNAIVEAGGEHAVIMAEYSLGDYPVPTTVNDYAEAFLSAVGTGDTDFALRLAPADGFASAELWNGLTSGLVSVEDAGDGTDTVTVPFQEGGQLVLTIDRAVAEAGGDHAITSIIFQQ